MKQTTCKSGHRGWESTLRKVYANKKEFEAFDNVYGIAKRLGFESATQAWKTNPRIMGSVNPFDLQIV